MILALGVLGACSSAPSGPPKGRPPPLVTTARVEVRDVPVEAKAPVDFRPVQQTDVGSKVLGYLDAVLVDVGDPVKKGQLLALVNPGDVAGQVSTVKGNLAQADAAIVLAKANYERAKQLHPSGIVSNAELDQARAAHDAALANRQALEGTLATAGARLGDTRILAPMDGFVYKRRLDPGALVGSAANPVILSVVRTDVLRVFARIVSLSFWMLLSRTQCLAPRKWYPRKSKPALRASTILVFVGCSVSSFSALHSRTNSRAACASSGVQGIQIHVTQ
jgi:multidrug efflux pump subunit AcrA (membrane-fusion protein)